MVVPLMSDRLTAQDLEHVEKWFGARLEDIDAERFATLHKAARKKFHPDNFAHLDDETVLEMAKDRFQALEKLASKVLQHFEREAAPIQAAAERYTSDGMALDIMTSDKTLKFQLFRSTTIYEGDKVSIPNTQAKLIARDDYLPRISTGFRDNIKLYLQFGPDDSMQDIVNWLFLHINGRSSNFVIEGKVVKIVPEEIYAAIRREARLELGPGSST